MYHNFFDQKGVNKMAQRKFIIDGGFKTDDASELLANLTMGGHILPNVDSNGSTGFDLGSTTAKWRDLYLSEGSLFINNQKVLQDDSGTIVVSADEDQGLTVKTTGTGVLALQSATTVNVNGTLQIATGNNITDSAGNAVSFGDKIDMNNNLVTNIGTAVASTDAANKSYVDSAISNLVNGAPGAMDTLNELANAMGDDANFSTTVTNSIATNSADIVTANTNIATNAADIATNTVAIASNLTAINTKTNEAYVDAQMALNVTASNTYADQAEADAKAYTDTRETAINTAWAAADSAQTSALQTYADTAEADAVSAATATASADATSKANAAEVDAKAYTDTRETAITTAYQSYADQAEADAESAAAADATSKANAALASAQSYADTAEADAISTAASDATSKADAALVAAKSYADQAEADAESAAAADATSKANAAQSAAISAAATDATTKADAAQAAAEATASADATAKADAAQAAAISSVTNGAGAAFDTLKEIQDAMATDAELSSAISSVTSSAASTASADATSKANAAQAAAISAAATDATTKADAAEADAISTAATDATSKANAAQAAAISTAAGDATTKANAALASALAADSDTTYSVGDGGLTQKNFTSTLKTKLDGIATGATNVTNNNQLTNGAGYITGYTDTNTTYTAGNGMTLSGTEFKMSGSYTGSFTATGDITAYSDDSLKTNVQVIDGALGRVEAIRGVTFERIEDGSVSTGVIAQELKAVLPEAVHTDAEGVHSVAYGNITGLLIEAVKELSAQVEELKKK